MSPAPSASCASRADQSHRVVADPQHSRQFSRLPLIGPWLCTIRNHDLMVPFEGFEDGLTGRFLLLNAERGRLWGGAASLFRGLSGQGCRGMGQPLGPAR